MFSKFQNGQVLFSWWPWLGQSAYNTEDEHGRPARASRSSRCKDQKIFSYGAEAYGGKQVFAIGSKAEDPSASPRSSTGCTRPRARTRTAARPWRPQVPKGLTWEVNDAGEPELTEFGKQVFLEGDADGPEPSGAAASTPTAARR